MGNVVAVCISKKKGEQKKEVPQVHVKVDHGIIGDAHAGNWHRQISLLAKESVAKVQENIDFLLQSGDFAENILTRDIHLHSLAIGTQLKVGSAVLEVTQIGKECHQGCVIREKAGDCVMPREGIFVKVVKEGTIKKEDEIQVISS